MISDRTSLGNKERSQTTSCVSEFVVILVRCIIIASELTIESKILITQGVYNIEIDCGFREGLMGN
jgi:hypothetical protein